MIVHGAYRYLNLQNSMKNGILSKGFPKLYIDVTTVVDDDYPNYKIYSLEDNSQIFTKIYIGATCRITNEKIIVYSTYLLQKYNLHVNLEYYTSIKSLKYIFKC